MTRETKVGLIVAGSFLCLVGIVVASKWHRGDAALDHEEQTVTPQVAAVKATQNTNGSETKKNDSAKKNEPAKPSLPAPPESKINFAAPQPSDLFDVSKLPPLQVPPPVKEKDVVDIKAELERQKNAALAQNQANNPVLPAAPKLDPVLLPLKPGEVTFPPLDKKPGDVVFPPLDKKPGDVTFPPLDKKPQDISFPPLDKKPGDVTFPPLKPAVPIEEKKPAPLEFPKQGNQSSLEFPPLSGGGIPVPTPKQDDLPKAPTFPPNKPDAPPVIKPFDVKDVPPAFPAIGTPTPLEKDVPKSGVSQVPNTKETFPPFDNGSPKPIPRIGATDLPSTPTITTNPGAQNRGLPVVKDTSSGVYEAQPGENNFAILSLKLYGTEKYADALLAYNREHRNAIKNGSAFALNPPAVNPGQQVLHPPQGILERDYRASIPNLTGSTIPSIPTSAPAVNLAKPSPLTPGVATVSNPPTTSIAGKYTVQNPTGESILDIAERVLGNRNRWHEIYRINPSYQPQFRIPAGTELKMPGA